MGRPRAGRLGGGGLRDAGARRQPAHRGARLVGGPPRSHRASAGRGGLCGAPLAPPLRAGRRCRPPADHRRGADRRRRAPARQPDRHRMGRADHSPRRHPGPARALPDEGAVRRGAVVPAVQRARRRLRPGRAGDPSRARRRHLRAQRDQDLDQPGPPGPARDPHRPDRSRGGQAQRHLVLRLPHGPARHHHASDRRHDHGALVQPGLLRRRPAPGRLPGRRGERRLAAGQGHARQRTGVAVERRRPVGQRPDGGRPARPAAGRRRVPATP